LDRLCLHFRHNGDDAEWPRCRAHSKRLHRDVAQVNAKRRRRAE
jgi:hypothetical protein